MELGPSIRLRRVADQLIGFWLTVIAHENHRFETPESFSEQPYRTVFEPTENRVLPFRSELVEGAAEADNWRPPQQPEKGPELPPGRYRPILESSIDDVEEATQPGGIELGGLRDDPSREDLKKFCLVLG
jgi:hypothetical protein